jgi:hypothetical protein
MNTKQAYWNKKLRDLITRLGRYIEIANDEKSLPGLRNDARRAIPALEAHFTEFQRRSFEVSNAS